MAGAEPPELFEAGVPEVLVSKVFVLVLGIGVGVSFGVGATGGSGVLGKSAKPVLSEEGEIN